MAVEITPANFFYWVGPGGCFECVGYFIEHGIDINAVYDGGTALHVAVAGENWDALRLLLEHNADPGVRGRSGITVMHVIASAGYDTESKYYPIRMEKRLEAVRLLISKGGDVSSNDDNGSTPLHYAAYYGIMDLIKFFIQNGADINAQRADGCTPTHIAMKSQHEEAVQLLKANGGKINYGVVIQDSIKDTTEEVLRSLMQPLLWHALGIRWLDKREQIDFR